MIQPTRGGDDRASARLLAHGGARQESGWSAGRARTSSGRAWFSSGQARLSGASGIDSPEDMAATYQRGFKSTTDEPMLHGTATPASRDDA